MHFHFLPKQVAAEHYSSTRTARGGQDATNAVHGLMSTRMRLRRTILHGCWLSSSSQEEEEKSKKLPPSSIYDDAVRKRRIQNNAGDHQPPPPPLAAGVLLVSNGFATLNLPQHRFSVMIAHHPSQHQQSNTPHGHPLNTGFGTDFGRTTIQVRDHACHLVSQGLVDVTAARCCPQQPDSNGDTTTTTPAFHTELSNLYNFPQPLFQDILSPLLFPNGEWRLRRRICTSDVEHDKVPLLEDAQTSQRKAIAAAKSIWTEADDLEAKRVVVCTATMRTFFIKTDVDERDGGSNNHQSCNSKKFESFLNCLEELEVRRFAHHPFIAAVRFVGFSEQQTERNDDAENVWRSGDSRRVDMTIVRDHSFASRFLPNYWHRGGHQGERTTEQEYLRLLDNNNNNNTLNATSSFSVRLRHRLGERRVFSVPYSSLYGVQLCFRSGTILVRPFIEKKKTKLIARKLVSSTPVAQQQPSPPRTAPPKQVAPRFIESSTTSRRSEANNTASSELRKMIAALEEEQRQEEEKEQMKKENGSSVPEATTPLDSPPSSSNKTDHETSSACTPPSTPTTTTFETQVRDSHQHLVVPWKSLFCGANARKLMACSIGSAVHRLHQAHEERRHEELMDLHQRPSSSTGARSTQPLLAVDTMHFINPLAVSTDASTGGFKLDVSAHLSQSLDSDTHQQPHQQRQTAATNASVSPTVATTAPTSPDAYLLLGKYDLFLPPEIVEALEREFYSHKTEEEVSAMYDKNAQSGDDDTSLCQPLPFLAAKKAFIAERWTTSCDMWSLGMLILCSLLNETALRSALYFDHDVEMVEHSEEEENDRGGSDVHLGSINQSDHPPCPNLTDVDAASILSSFFDSWAVDGHTIVKGGVTRSRNVGAGLSGGNAHQSALCLRRFCCQSLQEYNLLLQRLEDIIKGHNTPTQTPTTRRGGGSASSPQLEVRSPSTVVTPYPNIESARLIIRPRPNRSNSTNVLATNAGTPIELEVKVQPGGSTRNHDDNDDDDNREAPQKKPSLHFSTFEEFVFEALLQREASKRLSSSEFMKLLIDSEETPPTAAAPGDNEATDLFLRPQSLLFSHHLSPPLDVTNTATPTLADVIRASSSDESFKPLLLPCKHQVCFVDDDGGGSEASTDVATTQLAFSLLTLHKVACSGSVRLVVQQVQEEAAYEQLQTREDSDCGPPEQLANRLAALSRFTERMRLVRDAIRTGNSLIYPGRSLRGILVEYLRGAHRRHFDWRPSQQQKEHDDASFIQCKEESDVAWQGSVAAMRRRKQQQQPEGRQQLEEAGATPSTHINQNSHTSNGARPPRVCDVLPPHLLNELL